MANFRSVTTDGTVLKRNVERFYGFLITADLATNKITNYFRTEGQDPFVRALTVTVSVQVRSIVPLSERATRSTGLRSCASRTATKRTASP